MIPQNKMPSENANRYTVNVYSTNDCETLKKDAIAGKDGVYTVSEKRGNPTINTTKKTIGIAKNILIPRYAKNIL